MNIKLIDDKTKKTLKADAIIVFVIAGYNGFTKTINIIASASAFDKALKIAQDNAWQCDEIVIVETVLDFEHCL